MTIRKNDCRSNTPVSKQLSQFLLIDRKKNKKKEEGGQKFHSGIVCISFSSRDGSLCAS